MKGIIIEINRKNNRVIVYMGENEYTVLDTIGDADIKIDDIISGNLVDLGEEIIKDITKSDKRIFVSIVDSHCTKLNAQTLLDLLSD
jgi:hypothetical protein